MNTGELIKNIVVPVVTAATAVMVGVLNVQVSSDDQELRDRDQDLKEKISAIDEEIRSRDQQLKEKIGELDLLVRKTKEERAERESSQNFNLKIYEIVTKSLEERNPQKQETAKAFIVVMVDEPLRSSLLNVLKEGGDSRVKEEIGKILKEEVKFKRKEALIPQKRKEVNASYDWGEWDFDIFWCTASGAIAKTLATTIGEQLIAEGAKGRIRVRELPDSINAQQGYQIEGFAIRRSANEKTTAEALKKLSERAISETGRNVTFTVGLTRQHTPWYISMFVCPTS